jgi:regulatory protein
MPSEDDLSDPERCYASAMRILKFRWNGRAELRRKLLRKSFEADIVDAILERLTREKWLDDERFAASFVRDRARKRIGGRRIVAELRSNGIGDEDARRAVEENVDKEAAYQELIALCQKKMRILTRRHGLDFSASPEGRNKLLAYLLSHGYDMAESRDAMRECIKAETMGEQ